MNVMLQEFFISYYEFAPAAQISAFVRIRCVFGVFSLFLVMYFLSRKMTTERIDYLAGALEHEECMTPTWRTDPLSFVRSERRCVTLHKRDCDDSLETTKLNIENVLALRVGERRHWEIDFVRFLLGYTTALEERSFNYMSQGQNKLCSVEQSVTKLMGKSMTSLLGHNKKFKHVLDNKGAMPLNFLLDQLSHRRHVDPLVQHADGRIFASLLNGNDKQRLYVDIYWYDTWFPREQQMPCEIYIGCHQGHSTGFVSPSQVAHQLSPVECFALGWIFRTTDRRFQDSIHQNGLVSFAFYA